MIDNSGLELDDVFLERTGAIVLDATDPSGVPVYPPNVMMGIAPDFSLVGLDVIQSPARRARVVDRLTGNAIEPHAPGSCILALSCRAADSLGPSQLAMIERSCTLRPLDIPTVELTSGSGRFMIAGINLDPRPEVVAA